MAQRYPPKRLKLVDVLVLVSMVVFVLLVVMVILWRFRPLPVGPTCAGNLGAIGKAMLSYAKDYDGVFPCAGGPEADWVARLPWWAARTRVQAYGLKDPNASDGKASISASLYLLIKYAEVHPKAFVCNWDSAATPFSPLAYGIDDRDPGSLWDFGPEPPRHCSYAYHTPYGPDRLTAMRGPRFPIAADRTPWVDSPIVQAKDFTAFEPDIPPFQGTDERGRQGNSIVHRELGQNVLFVDGSVQFRIRPFAGIESDNIYTRWKDGDRIQGEPPGLGIPPADPRDSLLVNDPAVPHKRPREAE